MEGRERGIVETILIKLENGVTRAIPVDDSGRPLVGKKSEPVGYTPKGKPKLEDQKGKVVDIKS